MLTPLLAALLTACGGGGSDGSSGASVGSSASLSSTTNAATTTPTAATDASAAPVQAVATTATEEGSVSAAMAETPAVGTGDDASVSALAVAARTPVKTTTTVTATLSSVTLQAPYLRLVFVDGSASTASDSGPGSAATPYKTIAAAMARLQPGDDVVIAAGTYRESVVVPALNWGSASTRVRALTPRTVSIKGSSLVGGWTQVSTNLYSVPWSGEEPEMVVNGSTVLQQVGGTVFGGYPTRVPITLAGVTGIWPGRVAGSYTTMAANSFWYDGTAKRLYVRLAAALTAGQQLEVSTQRHVLIADSAIGLTVDGLDFAHANTSYTYRWGAVKVMGSRNLINNVNVRDMDGACVQLIGNDSALTNSVIDGCGQVGVTGRGNRLRFEGNQILRGNTRNFDIWWEAGGMKLIGAGGEVDGLNDAVIRNNVVAFNNGNGIWIDWKNARNLIESNTTAYNSGFGIQYEASQTGTIQKNLSYGNGLRGIYLIESSNTLVQSNAVFGNALEGIAAVDGTRSATDTLLKPYGNQIIGNTIAWNDFNRNWVQLVLPGRSFANVSNRNVLKAERIAPRLSMGFISSTNPAFEQLIWWQTWMAADLASTSETVAMPATLSAAIAAKRLLSSAELPSYLVTPGTP